MTSNYIVCSTQRSGSTFFCQCLAQSGKLGIPDEWLVFLEYSPENNDPFQQVLSEKPLEEIIRVVNRVQIESSGQTVTGWKIMWSTMSKLGSRLESGDNKNKKLFSIFNEELQNPQYIFLERYNKIAQAISDIVMKRSGVSHARNETELASLNQEKEKMEIENREISANIREILSCEAQWHRFFADNNIDPMRIVYEDFCNDINSSLGDVANFLVVSGDVSLPQSGDVRLRKTRTRFEQDCAINYLAEVVDMKK